MGFMTGQGADAFTKNFLSTYTTMNEQARLAEDQKMRAQQMQQQQQIQQMQMQAMRAEQERKAGFQNAISGMMAPIPGMDEGSAYSAAGNSPELWGAMNPDGSQDITEEGQGLVDSAMGPQPAPPITPEMYMQKIMPHLPPEQQVELIKEQMKPKAEGSLNEYKVLQAAAMGDPVALRMMEMKQELARGEKKAPTGYRYTPDGQMEPVPGGPADWKRQEKEVAAYTKVQEITSSMDDIATKAQALKTAKGLKGNFGIRGVVPNLPGSDAANAKVQLDALKSSVGLTVLANLKAGTGAGLGSVTEAEHKLLQGMIANLEKAQSEEQVQKALDTIITYTDKAKGRISDGYDRLYGQKAAGNAENVMAVDPVIKSASQNHGVPEHLIRAVIKNESNFNTNATSRAGAKGMMQLMPGTAKEMGVGDVNDPAQNIAGGTKYLSLMIQKFGDVPTALAAYNAGPGKVEQLKRLWPSDWQSKLPMETKQYVAAVLKTSQGYQQAQQPAQTPANGGMIKYKRVQ